MHGTFIEIMLPLCLGVLIWFGWMPILVATVSIVQKVVNKGRANFLWQRVTMLIVGWFPGPQVENKSYPQPPEVLCNSSSIYIIYNCGCGSYNTTRRPAV
jgi:hypothetical protein